MYHVQLHFWIRGIDEGAVRVWKKIEALPRFEHVFHLFSRSMRLPAGRNQIVFLDDKAPLQMQMLRQDIGPEGKIIVCCDEPGSIPADDLACVDDVWPSATLPEIATFRFQRLLERLKAEKDAWLNETYLEQTINTLPDMIWFKDLKGLHLHVNDAFCTAVNKPRSDIEGHDHYYIWGIPRAVYERSDYVCVETEDDVIKARKTCLFDEQVMSAQGLRKLKTYKTPIFDEDGKTIIGTVGIARDVTRENEYKDTIQRLSREDKLTGLANRDYFHHFAEMECKDEALTLVLIDLDHFREVNEKYGHELGDAVLKIAAEELGDVFPDDLKVRMGGDEFGVLLRGVHPAEAVRQDVETFQKQLQEMYAMDERMKRVQANAGIAQCKAGTPLDKLIFNSSAARAEAAKQGKGACYVASGGDEDADD